MKGYNNLKKELKKMRDMPVNVLPVVAVGEFGATLKKLKQRLSDIGIEMRIVESQKATILYSARIHQNVLEVWEVERVDILPF